MKKELYLFACFFFLAFVLNAQIINVPGDFTTIQAAINASASGDTIVVSPGTYYENINFRGKNILLTSLFYADMDTSYISSTIINGSQPQNTDTASCVIICSGEDSTAVLQGFTITGGTGTKWTDIHNLYKYREGGGILIELSSPTIRHNNIKVNVANDVTGVASAGGGGIRIGDGNPRILNNIIAYNQGFYGPGIVLNYTGVTIRNNIIAYNTAATQFSGGAGIWAYNIHGTDQRIIENNTIAANESSLGTGGVLAWSTSLVMKNNIIRDNLPLASQVKTVAGTLDVTYCNILNGFAGSGNIDEDPEYMAEQFILSDGSPCIDKGDSSVVYDDPEDAGNPGHAKFPSKGLLRNDMGVYGGPGSFVTGYIVSTFPTGIVSECSENSILLRNYPNPSTGYSIIEYDLPVSSDILIRVTDLYGRIMMKTNMVQQDRGRYQRELDLSAYPLGLYNITLMSSGQTVTRKLLVR